MQQYNQTQQLQLQQQQLLQQLANNLQAAQDRPERLRVKIPDIPVVSPPRSRSISPPSPSSARSTPRSSSRSSPRASVKGSEKSSSKGKTKWHQIQAENIFNEISWFDFTDLVCL